MEVELILASIEQVIVELSNATYDVEKRGLMKAGLYYIELLEKIIK